jgi:16S rRNA (guanine1207-N2)-methyltransferase
VLTEAAALLYRQASSLIAEAEQPSVAILHAEPHPLLRALADQAGHLELQQSLRGTYLALEADGLQPSTRLSDRSFDLILLLPGKQREQTLGWMAQAMEQLRDGGRLLVCCPNAMGAKSYEKRLQSLAGNIESFSKSKCRCFAARRTPELDRALMQAWTEAAAVRRVPQLGLYSQPGLFSWDRPDPGSEMLLACLPGELAGRGMDLGCGNGYLSVQALKRFPGIDGLHAIDAERLAVDCAAMNLEPFADRGWQTHWCDATEEPLPDNLDWALLNPPFHSGKQQDTELGQKIIAAACRSLKPGGHLFLVANRQLPYEAVLRQQLRSFTTLRQEQGYKVIEGRR